MAAALSETGDCRGAPLDVSRSRSDCSAFFVVVDGMYGGAVGDVGGAGEDADE